MLYTLFLSQHLFFMLIEIVLREILSYKLYNTSLLNIILTYLLHTARILVLFFVQFKPFTEF